MPTPTWTAPELTPDDLVSAANLCRTTLAPALDRDWETLAFDMEWTCRRTLDHVVDVMFFYAAHLATRATQRLPPPRNGDPARTPAELLDILPDAAAILGEVVRAAPPEARGFHGAGMADGTGFLGMGCEEIVMHTDDIARVLGVPFDPPAELLAKIIARIFPWAPTNAPAWDAIRWCAGRGALPDRPRQDHLWYWHCAPLAEWDGTIRRRGNPAMWR
jgi:hypothetical protein